MAPSPCPPSARQRTGTRTYTGGTTINGGASLSLGNGGLTGSIAGNIVDNGTLDIRNRANMTLAGAISGSGDVVLESPAHVTLSNASNSYTGRTYLAAGTLELQNSTRRRAANLSIS